MTKIESAGYIVHDNDAIWGYGATEDAAWSSFQAEMQNGGVEVVDEPTEAQLDDGDWTRKSGYQVRERGQRGVAGGGRQGRQHGVADAQWRRVHRRRG